MHSFFKILGLMLLFVLNNSLYAQSHNLKDSIPTEKDTIQIDSAKIIKHSVFKATLLSAIVPGAGQIYNKQYWKVPIIYAGIGGLIYLSKYNNKMYKYYKNQYAFSELPDPMGRKYVPSYISDSQLASYRTSLLRYKRSFKRDRDVNYIIIGGLYLLNVLDATVYASMFDYDISDDLTLRVSPCMINSDNVSAFEPAFGLRCSFKF